MRPAGRPAARTAAYRLRPLIAAATLSASPAVAAEGHAGQQPHAKLLRVEAGTVFVAEPRVHEGLARRLDGGRRIDRCLSYSG